MPGSRAALHLPRLAVPALGAVLPFSVTLLPRVFHSGDACFGHLVAPSLSFWSCAGTPPTARLPRPSQRGYKVRALSRSADKVRQQFGDAPGLSAAIADLRDPDSLPAALEGVDAVCCCTGTTAFPSKR